MPRRARDPTAQSAALQMLARGLASATEAARMAGVSRQLVQSWARSAGIDWRKARHAALAAEWRKHALGERQPIRKAKLRKIAEDAKAKWDRDHGDSKVPD